MGVITLLKNKKFDHTFVLLGSCVQVIDNNNNNNNNNNMCR